MQTIATFKAACADCESEFAYPLLGDFTYGHFLLKRSDGMAFKHFDAISHPVWKVVERILDDSLSAEVLQELVARLADPDQGHRFSMKYICPECKSHHFKYWGGDRVHEIEVQDATFDSFTSRTAEDQSTLVASLSQTIIADCTST